MQTAAQRFGVDARLLALVGQQESDLGKTLENGLGDSGHGFGIFQLDDQKRPGATPRDPALLERVRRDPEFASNVAAAMLRRLMDQYGGDVRKALSAYNTGSVNATGLAYADQVLGRGR